MSETDPQKIAEKVTRHGAEIENLERSISSLDRKVETGFSDIYAKLAEISKAVSGIGRTDFKTIIAVLGVMAAISSFTFTALVIVGGLVARPVIRDIEKQTEAIIGLRERADSNRVLTLRSHDSLRGAAVEQETQLGFVHALSEVRLEALYLQLNAERRANGETPLDVPAFTKEIVHRAEIPGLFE